MLDHEMTATAPLSFEAIMRQTQARIRAYIAGMGVASSDVDDLAQDVYVELYRQFDNMPPDVAPERWLKGIARNLCMNFFRRTSRRGRLHRAALAEMLQAVETKCSHSLAEKPVRAALDVCYEKLPDNSRKILSLRYQQELPSAEIAQRMNSTAEAVRVALFRIRAGLKDCIANSLAR